MLAKKICLLLLLALNCHAIGTLRKLNATERAIGQTMPADLTNECSGSFTRVSNCGGVAYDNCNPAKSGIFSESWDFPGPPGTAASSFLTCHWEGLQYSGICQPQSSAELSNYCYLIVQPTPSRSETPTPSPTVSSSRAASSSMAASPSVSSSSAGSPSVDPSTSPSASWDPWQACYDMVTPTFNIQVQKIGFIPDATVTVGSEFSLDLSNYFCDPEQEAMTYTVEGNLPPGLAISGSTLSGTMTTAGQWHVTVYAWDVVDNPPSPSITFYINVTQ